MNLQNKTNRYGGGGNYHDRQANLYANTYNRDWVKHQLGAVCTLKLIAAYNEARLSKKNTGTLKNEALYKIAEISYPLQYEKNRDLAKNRVIRMLKTKEVRELADQSLIQMLVEKGIDKNYLTETRKRILEECLGKEKYETALKALQGFEEMHNLMSKATYQSTETREEVDYSKFLATKTVKTIAVEATDNVTISAGNIENEEKNNALEAAEGTEK